MDVHIHEVWFCKEKHHVVIQMVLIVLPDNLFAKVLNLLVIPTVDGT